MYFKNVALCRLFNSAEGTCHCVTRGELQLSFEFVVDQFHKVPVTLFDDLQSESHQLPR